MSVLGQEMDNNISLVDYLDKKLAEILRPVSPQEEYIENLHHKLKHRSVVQIGKPYYYSFFVYLLIMIVGIIIIIVLKKMYRILTPK